jgi:hypothetical protein
MRVFRQSRGAFRTCYEEHLRPCPNLQTAVRVEFVIGTDGRVMDAKGTGEASEETVDCIVRAVSELRFPRPKRRTPVSYPMMFTPGEE